MAGTLVVSTLSDGTNSTSATNPIRGSARAWAQFTGATAAINNSFNISSITRNASGDYTFNFTTAMSSANYCFIGLGTGGGATYQIAGGSQSGGTTLTTTSLRTQYGYVDSVGGSLGNQDPTRGYLAVFSS